MSSNIIIHLLKIMISKRPHNIQVLAVRKLHNGGDLPLDSLFQVPLTGVQPRLDPGISSGGRRWRKDSNGERQRLDLTGLRGKPIKFVTPSLL